MATPAASSMTSRDAARPRELILTFYGLYREVVRGWISIAHLIRLMAEVDVDAPAVRSAVSRQLEVPDGGPRGGQPGRGHRAGGGQPAQRLVGGRHGPLAQPGDPLLEHVQADRSLVGHAAPWSRTPITCCSAASCSAARRP